MIRKGLRGDDCGGKQVVEFLQKVLFESSSIASDFRDMGGGRKSSSFLERPDWNRLSKGTRFSLLLTLFTFSL